MPMSIDNKFYRSKKTKITIDGEGDPVKLFEPCMREEELLTP